MEHKSMNRGVKKLTVTKPDINIDTSTSHITKNTSFFDVVVALALFVTILLTAVIIPVALSAIDSVVAGYEQPQVEGVAPDGKILSTASPDDVFRLHIIANSDSQRDQSTKLAVRDAILEYERNNAEAIQAQSPVELEHMLMHDGEALLATVRNVLKTCNAGYDAQLIIGEFDFPDRTYGSTLYPAGRYEALRILLGNAQGKNWWCVLFPPLCIVRANVGEIEYTKPVRFDSIFVRLWQYIIGGNRK